MNRARTAERRGEDVPTRIVMLEGDADANDKEHVAFGEALETMNRRLAWILGVMVCGLVSIISSLVVLVVSK